MIAMISFGALPNVAFRKPPIPGPVWRARLSVALADQPGQRDQRRASKHEQCQLAEGVELIQNHDEGRQQQRQERAASDVPLALHTQSPYWAAPAARRSALPGETGN